jgi:hypothetical protein
MNDEWCIEDAWGRRIAEGIPSRQRAIDQALTYGNLTRGTMYIAMRVPGTTPEESQWLDSDPVEAPEERLPEGTLVADSEADLPGPGGHALSDDAPDMDDGSTLWQVCHYLHDTRTWTDATTGRICRGPVVVRLADWQDIADDADPLCGITIDEESRP